MPLTGNKKPEVFYGYIVVFIAFFVLVIMSGTLYSYGVFLKSISAEFGWTRATTSGAYSLSVLLFGLLYIVTGRLTDRFGPRLVVTVCGFFLGLGCILMSQINSVWELYLYWGIIVAIGLSGSFVPMVSTVAKWFLKRRGAMTGIVAAGVGVGTMVVPPVASWLTASYGWRTSFIVIGLVALILLILAAQFLKRDPSTMGLLPYGGSDTEQLNLISEDTGFSFKEAIHTRQFWMVCVVFFCFSPSFMAIMAHIVPHAIDLGTSAMIAASVLSTIGALGVVGRIGIGSISDRAGVKLSLIISCILMSVGLICLLIAQELWTLYVFAIIFGFGTGGLVALESPVTAELFGLRAHGTILGAIIFSATIGGSIGSLLSGHIFDITSSYQLAFLAFVVLGITSIILASLLSPTRRQNQVGKV